MLDVYNIIPHMTKLPLPLRIVSHLLRLIMAVLTTLYAIPPYLVWAVLLYPMRYICWDLYWIIEGFLFNGLLAIMGSWLISGEYSILETGDDITSLLDQKVLVIANHQSTADVPLLMNLIQSKPGVGGKVMWIIDSTFKYTHFGIVSNLRGDFFIEQGKAVRNRELSKLQEHLNTIYMKLPRKWLVLFPEGGFLRKRRVSSKAFALKKGLPSLEHITLPRTGAMQVIMQICEKHHNCDTKVGRKEADGVLFSDSKECKLPIKWILDMTIAYPNGRPLDLHGIAVGYWPPSHTIVHHRAYPAHSVPVDGEGLTKWCYDRFVEKEELLDRYYRDGVLPSESDKQKRELPFGGAKKVHPDLVGVLMFHSFYIASFYIQVTFLLRPLLAFIF